MLRMILMLAAAWLWFKPPAPPYLGPVKWFGAKNNKPINRVVIHGAVVPCEPGWARKVVDIFKRTTRPSSAHYVVDPREVFQAVFDSVEAYHAPPNRGSLGVELCDLVVGPLSRWRDKNHTDMLKLAAKLVAELCLAYDIPIRKIGPIGLLAGRKGICGHNNIRDAWHQTTHWDPGKFPWRRFIRMARAEAERIRAEDAPAPRKPRNTRVRRAHAILDDAFDLLANVPKSRRRVHNLHSRMAELAEKLPEE